MSDADLLDDVIARLWTLRARLGPEVYRRAALAALNAIAATVMDEAERRAGVGRRAGSVVVRFPARRRARAAKNRDGES